jgi:hypothetical protein
MSASNFDMKTSAGESALHSEQSPGLNRRANPETAGHTIARSLQIVETALTRQSCPFTPEQVAEAFENVSRMVRAGCCGGVESCVNFTHCLNAGYFDEKPKTYVCEIKPHHDRVILDNRYYSVDQLRKALCNRSDETSHGGSHV